MTTLTLNHVGRDNFYRPVYECEGRLYVDVDPRKNHPPDIYQSRATASTGSHLAPFLLVQKSGLFLLVTPGIANQGLER